MAFDDQTLTQQDPTSWQADATGSVPIASCTGVFNNPVADPVFNTAAPEITTEATINPELIEQTRGAGMMQEMAPAVSTAGELFGAICDTTAEAVGEVSNHLQVGQPEVEVAAPVGDTADHTVQYTAEITPPTPSNGMG